MREFTEKMKSCLDQAFQKRAILESEKGRNSSTLWPNARCHRRTARRRTPLIVNRLMVATFGLVPRRMDLSSKPPEDGQLASGGPQADSGDSEARASN